MTGKFNIFLFLVLVLNTGCVVRSIAPGDGLEVNMDFDLSAMNMRHGFQNLTAPEIRYMGVDDKESELRGQALFLKHCQKCHGETGIGDGPLAKDLNIKPANLRDIDYGTTNTYLVVQINKGRGNMPSWEHILTKQQMFDLTNYIRSLAE